MERKKEPGSLGRALVVISAAVLLGACVKPTSSSDFMNDPAVNGILNRDRGGIFGPDIGYEGPERLDPVVIVEGGAGEAGTAADPVMVDFSGAVTFKVDNASDYDPGSIEWHCNGELVGSGAELSDDALEDVIDEESPYQLSAEGKVEGAAYSAYVYVRLIE